MTRKSVGVAVTVTLVLLVSFAVVAKAAPPPKAQSVVLSEIKLDGCNALQFGFVTTRETERKLGSKKEGCEAVFLNNKKLVVEIPDGSQLWFKDVTCNAIYYSDGTGDGNHARITDLGYGVKRIDISDAGYGCGNKEDDSVPPESQGNLTLIYTPQ